MSCQLVGAPFFQTQSPGTDDDAPVRQKTRLIATWRPGQPVDAIRFEIGFGVFVHGALSRRIRSGFARVDVEPFDPPPIGSREQMDGLTGEDPVRIQHEPNATRVEHPLHGPVFGQIDSDVSRGEVPLRTLNTGSVQQIDPPILQIVQRPRRRDLEPIGTLCDVELELVVDPKPAAPDLVAERPAVTGERLHFEAKTFFDGHSVSGQVGLQTVRVNGRSIR